MRGEGWNRGRGRDEMTLCDLREVVYAPLTGNVPSDECSESQR